MAVKALRQKLEEQLEHTENEGTSLSETTVTNLVPFTKPELQVVSVVPEFAITLHDAKERISMLQDFVKEMMIPGLDYGVIPKCEKPSLFKAGAEKLCDIFGFSKHVEVINRVEDWDNGLFHYEVKATLINKRSGYIEAEGVGSCNNREKKYATSSPFNIINTLLKMAKKRAFVDAVLSATRSSGLFSQDLEDMEDYELAPPKENANFKQNTEGTKCAEFNSQRSSPQEISKPATRNQLNKIQGLVNEKNVPVSRVKSMIQQRYSVQESRNMTLKQADDFIKYLMKYTGR